MLIPSKRVKIYPNNKPWVNKSVKSSLKKKKLAFQQGEASDLHTATKELKVAISQAKQSYRATLENKMASNSLGSAWASMKTIAGLQNTRDNNSLILTGFRSDTDFANALNCFYNRFNTSDFSKETQELRLELSDNQHFSVEQKDVEEAFYCTKANKSHGPDNICGHLLKTCAEQLSPVFQNIFNRSLEEQHVPRIWKDAVIVPVPKCSRLSELNDFRPVALTSIIMKIFEKLVRVEILRNTVSAIDQLQFAYRPKRGVEDATVTLLNLLFKHLEGSGCHARLLFIDFSSAFNTIQPHILTQRLVEHFDLSNNLMGWILDFLTNRTQRVRVNGFLSDKVCSSTGSPQGCVLSPLLFILYTNMCQSTFNNRFILKYADDSVIVSLLQGNENSHGPIIDSFVRWCEDSHLHLNTLKTKDMAIDFRKNASTPESIIIKGQAIERVQSYKYLGTIIDSTLNFKENCEAVCKKGHQRLYCLRKLSRFHIDKTMMTLFYRAFIESVLAFSLVSWFGNLPLKDRNSLSQIIKWSGRLIGESQLCLESLYTRQLQRLASSISNDDSHPLASEFQLMPSGRRFRVPRSKTRRYGNSFVPAAVSLLNKS